MRNLTAQYLRETEAALNAAISLAGITTIAPLACGYQIARRTVEYTDSDRAWFRAPIKGGR